MAVDLEAIARRGRCEVSSLRIALPLIEQGYSPPFLARYRRDELSGADEASLWALASVVNADQSIAVAKESLVEKWEATALADPAIGNAIRKSNSQRVLDRLARRIKQESGEAADPSTLLAVRVLNPQKGDGADLNAIAVGIEAIDDATAAIQGVDAAIAKRLSGDPRVIASAVRWLAKNAKIHIANIHDPHTPGQSESTAESKSEDGSDEAARPASAENAVPHQEVKRENAAAETTPDNAAGTATAPAEPDSPSTGVAVDPSSPPTSEPQSNPVVSEPVAADATEPDTTEPDGADKSAANSASAAPVTGTDPVGDAAPSAPKDPAITEPATSAQPTTSKPTETQEKGKAASAQGKPAAKKTKKVSPRQRRRRWLVGVLKPLAGKRFAASKLSSFQIVMLGRALRSQVAQCSFEYDAAKLVAEIKRTVGALNRPMEDKLGELVLEHEASIREAAEGAWWDELHEKASNRLISIAADHLQRQINRGGVDAKVVMSIDAVGPRTAATSIVSADGRVVHCEDLPCQLSSGQRAQAVSKMGELIHAHHVDLIVISNGPSRRACMVALSDLITQSPDASVRWTLADRSGADAYAGSDIAGQEMRSTSRRFRAAAWLAFSIMQPAQALAKVDPLKLRLSSFQRELSDDAMRETLENVMTSGASRGGVDANAASVGSLGRLPGMTDKVAAAIDKKRRESLISSRDEMLGLDGWETVAESRQSLPFLRVFGSEEVLDGTLIHPDDYPLAKKLAKALEIELPPATPPGYTPPDFSDKQTSDDSDAVSLKEAAVTPDAPVVEDLTKTALSTAETFAADLGGTEPDGNEGSATEPESSAAEVAEPQEPEAEATEEQPANTEESTTEAPAGESAPPDESAADAEPKAETDSQTAREPESSEANANSDETSTDAAAESVPDRVRTPRPDQAKIDKCVKEWQVGPNRVNQLVNWLCDPFGDSDVSGVAPAVLSTMPTQATLKEGDEVIGVVVGVMPFGVFVELAPDCSGLIHVSKVTDSFVEDLHEAIQVGDVVTAWVTGIDAKKKRVALSALSPQREAELRAARANRPQTGRGGRPQRGAGRSQGSNAGQRGGSGPRSSGSGQRSGGQRTGSGQGGGKPGGGQARSGRGNDSRGGRGKQGARGGGRGRDSRGGRRDRKPESYNVVGKKIEKPITDAMQKGEEPLRSFGDLLKFYDKDKDGKKEVKKTKAKQPDAEKPKTDKPQEDNPTPVSESGEKPATDNPVTETVSQVEPPAANPPSPKSVDATEADSSEPTASTDSPAS